ncbi:MAG: PQQ-binding-like beta-propeller repeat protein [Planctomycetales bacterium]
MTSRIVVAVPFCAVLFSLSLLHAATPDWAQWRGPDRTGVSTETGLLKSWGSKGPELLWKTSGLGKGFSSIAIHDGKIFTIGRFKGDDYLIARNLADGKELWKTKFSSGAADPNGTPAVSDGLVYAISNSGDLVCCKTEDGRKVWEKNFGKDFGGKMMSSWGYSESPLVDGDRLICTPGAPDAMIVALDKKTGATIWKSSIPSPGKSGADGAGYSSIVISHACGIKQYVQLTGRGVVGIAAEDGKPLWGYNRIANNVANIPTPVIKGDYVFCSTGYGAGSALLKLNKSAGGITPEEVYFLEGNKLQNHHGGFVLIGDYIYMGDGHNNGFPTCIEFETGKLMWGKKRGPGTGSAAVVAADGQLYFRYESGKMALIEATPASYKLHGTFDIPKGGDPSWSHPVVLDGKLYLREQDNLMCYDVKAK